jgi:hypothetical protein
MPPRAERLLGTEIQPAEETLHVRTRRLTCVRTHRAARRHCVRTAASLNHRAGVLNGERRGGAVPGTLYSLMISPWRAHRLPRSQSGRHHALLARGCYYIRCITATLQLRILRRPQSRGRPQEHSSGLTQARRGRGTPWNELRLKRFFSGPERLAPSAERRAMGPTRLPWRGWNET